MLGREVGVLTEAITCALDLDDDGVVKEAIEQRCGDHGMTEDLTPSAKPRLEERIVAVPRPRERGRKSTRA
jgi:hypothetical protein